MSINLRRRAVHERLLDSVVRAVRLLSRPNTYALILLITLLLIVVGMVVVTLFENDATGEPGLRDLENSFIYMLQNVFGVGIGALSPKTLAGRIAAVFIVIVAAANRGLFVAAVVSGFVNRILVQGKGLRRVNLKDHIIICGWNPRAKQIVQVMQRDAFGKGAPIVVLANLPQNPLLDSNIKLVTGDPLVGADLERAGVKVARSAIVITDESENQHHSDSIQDARGVMTVLAIKSANPSLHVVAEVRDPANRHHFEHARADELIVNAEMSEGLLARAALNTGIAEVFSDLLRLDTAPEMYVMAAPATTEGKTFQAAAIYMQIRSGSILVGIIEDGAVMLAPPLEFKVHKGTQLVVLSNLRPALSH